MNIKGVFRGFLGAGEAINFGLDSIAVPYVKESGVIFAFYTTGVLIFLYLGAFHITETEYFNHEEDVVIPKHVLQEHVADGVAPSTDGSLGDEGVVQEKVNAADQKQS